ncbi:hypothetical protein JCM10021v2_005698 [Rhodotorula toruloides]
MSYPSRNPNAPHYPRGQTYEPDPAAFHSTSYPSTGVAANPAYPSDPTARYGLPPGAGAGGGGGMNRRQTVRGAQRGTVREAGANPRLSMAPGPQRGLTRGKTLTRPDRFVAPAPLIAPAGLGKAAKQGGNVQTKLVDGVPTLVASEPWWSPWSLFVEIVTFWAPRPLLRTFGMTDPVKQRAWKEKVALCEIAAFLMGIIGFITIGLNRTLLAKSTSGSKDATRIFYTSDELKRSVKCLASRYYAGHIDKITPGCFVSNLFLYVSLILIMGIVLARFFMALVFSWYLADRMVRKPRNLKRSVVSPAVLPEGANIDVTNTTGQAPWVESHVKRQQTMRLKKGGGRRGAASEKALPLSPSEKPRGGAPKGRNGTDVALPVGQDGMISMASIGAELFCVCLVTCYSEGYDGIKTTLDSIAATNYSDARKLLFVVCDGMITGSGEKMSTPDIVVSMIERDARFGDPQPMSYVAIADGAKAHNQAMVYAGHYTQVAGHRTPIIVVVKCGTPAEASEAKPGNRGKRDSQMVLMNFFGRVTYNDRMSPLDYDLFRKTQSLMGVTPDFFEVCLMVDADTMCYPESLGYLVRVMQNDNMVMGVCGETRIANKRQSWVTMIQVFEYFISHHLAKAFESVFGGVTCLPGCFSMYRIKARKQDDGDWFPVLVSPTITSEYSQSVVTTLHQKNLLLLGEDRFLTTILLRTFPNRKMMFCPKARCRTVVPDTFKVLLSQRRRWINSTIHNLMELVLVRNLCGTFCFSMQFITFIDLIGTVVLPIAICLTYTLIISSIINPPNSFGDAIPLVLLVGVLGLPGILILISTMKVVYVGWMLIYLLALPIWNCVLPLYAFSKFDDFSWGETRKVAGETKGGDDHGASGGVSAASAVPLRRWEDWEKSRLRKIRREEKRRREFERQFGSRAVHPHHSISTFAESETASSFGGPDEDRWGQQIGAYNEDATSLENVPPPVGLYSLDEVEDDDDQTLNQHDLVNVLEVGWDDASPIGSPLPGATYPHHGNGSGYSTPSEQAHLQPRQQGYGQQQHYQAPTRGWTLTDTPLSAPPMTKTASSASNLPLNASSSSLASSGRSSPRADDPFADANSPGGVQPPPLISPLSFAHDPSYTSLASSTATGFNTSVSSEQQHARRRSLTNSPQATRGDPLMGSGAGTPSPTKDGRFDWPSDPRNGGGSSGGGGGRRLV